MWRDQVELRKHILEFDIDKVSLLRETPDLVPDWHQGTKYYLSIHPFIDDPAIPIEAPKSTKDGEYAVTKEIAAREPPVKGKHLKHIPFDEKVILHTEYPMPNCQILLWGTCGNIAHKETVLLGKCVISLFDYRMQRKVLPWIFKDFTVDAPAAEMYLKYEVKTTPAPVQLLHLTDVMTNKVTLHWTKPLNDHGAPIQGYKIEIMVNHPTTGPEWHTLCPCTKTTYTAYIVDNLTGNTEYLINVKAVNMVGDGDPCEFQILTAPVEPNAPDKPWIQEARDGCLCVAWHASSQDGGTPITAYKVQMSKLVGATKMSALMKVFNTIGEDAAYVDIGSVGAVMDEMQDQPSVYTVWAGPLDAGSCEYRFRVYAVNGAGVSKPSELTEPHYTA
jgi:hypothetical protein